MKACRNIKTKEVYAFQESLSLREDMETIEYDPKAPEKAKVIPASDAPAAGTGPKNFDIDSPLKGARKA